MEVLRFALRRMALSVADRVVTNPLFAWTWSGAPARAFTGRLTDFRSADAQTIVEMMEGKYLLGARFIDTHGVSPFAIETDAADWLADLHSFGWLRHFRDLRDPGQRRFARTLVMDWIGRYGGFDRETWSLFVTARRVLNWLKNYALLTEGANPDQIRTINRALAVQLQSLVVRAPLEPDPLPRLMAQIAMAGAALSASEDDPDTERFLARLEAELNAQLDADGLHRSRNPFAQIQILTELIPVSQLLSQRRQDLSAAVGARVEIMQRALDRLVLGTREPAYMNGCGQAPVELVLSIAAQSGARGNGTGSCGGYGILVDGSGKLVADSGLVPPAQFAQSAHAGGLSFEFSSHGALIVGNCGPAPAQLPESRNLFRHTSAHSAPTIDDLSNASLSGGSLRGSILRPRGTTQMTVSPEDCAIEMRSSAYRNRYGLDIVRSLTLLGGGHTLVGQDRLLAASRRHHRQGDAIIRFHLAPDVAIDRADGEDLIRLVFKSGPTWAFLWEGARADIEESVRHSAHFGLVKTRQIVLSGPARPDTEIAWVFTRQ
ncbi:heparinase II/III family protein [Pelagibacterium xiamenense]|uniref:heparinase II/III family protein n=1 Tax=Pelagibacterium xiamenense TaxID=2901140 RepID=UPI001E46DF1E|nr:heparinase II/III family protein [Pelagibacterium xiamenense]MCD7058306.1 heparinase II/III family protein [Pelagibacterium xiamenense]